MGYIIDTNKDILDFSPEEFFTSVHGDIDIIQMKIDELDSFYNEFKEIYTQYDKKQEELKFSLHNTEEQARFINEDIKHYMADGNIDASTEFLKEIEFLKREKIDTLMSIEDIRIKKDDLNLLMKKVQADLLYLFITSLKSN